MVRLLRSVSSNQVHVKLRFNPTMVRLLPVYRCSPNEVFSGFNPTMVRLLQELDIDRLTQLLVSIPQWCDCCVEDPHADPANDPSFNPTMVRLLLPERGAAGVTE